MFTQEDPIGLAGGLNLYGYAGGDPVNFSDPFGLCPDCILDGIAVAAGIYEIARNGASASNIASLAADVAGLLIPGVPSVGGVKLAAKAVDAVRGSRRGAVAARREAVSRATSADGVVSCEYCGQSLTKATRQQNSLELDHIDPWARGGSSDASNLAASCLSCNRSKGARTPEEAGMTRPKRQPNER